MTHFKPDNRKSNALFLFGIVCLGLTYFTLTSGSVATRSVWTVFLVATGLIFIGISLLFRYKVSMGDNELVLKNRLGFLTKKVQISDINRVKVIERPFPLAAYYNNLLHLFLRDKKFKLHKEIYLFDIHGGKIVSINGQSIDNDDFNKLARMLKSAVRRNLSILK